MAIRRMVSALALLLGLLVVATESPRAQAADAYQVDPAHAAVVFRIKHLGFSYCLGRFNDISGGVVVDEDNPANLVLDIQVKADSVDTGNTKRDQHLKGADFFNVKDFPLITFKSKQAKLVKDNTYEVTGDLTLHGITRTITVPVERVGSGKDPQGHSRTGFESSFSIKRSDYGMNTMNGGIGDEVWLLVGFEALRQ